MHNSTLWRCLFLLMSERMRWVDHGCCFPSWNIESPCCGRGKPSALIRCSERRRNRSLLKATAPKCWLYFLRTRFARASPHRLIGRCEIIRLRGRSGSKHRWTPTLPVSLTSSNRMVIIVFHKTTAACVVNLAGVGEIYNAGCGRAGRVAEAVIDSVMLFLESVPERFATCGAVLAPVSC